MGQTFRYKGSLFWISLPLFFLHALLYYSFTVDDAYISFRYAANLVMGNGVVFNPGERVEGYTNFLLVLLEAFMLLLGVDLVHAVKGIGLVSSVLVLLLTRRLGLMLFGETSLAPALAPLFLAASAPFAVAAITGLETQLFTAWVVSGVLFYLRWIQSAGLAGCVLASLCFAMAGLTRPEGALFFAITWLHTVAVVGRGTTRGSLLPLVLMTAPILLVMGPYLAWHWVYFGQALPNTFYAKTQGTFSLQTYIAGLGYLSNFMRDYGGALLFLLLVPLLLDRLTASFAYLAALLLGYSLFVVFTGGDWIPEYRFLVPIIPILYLLSLHGAARALEGLGRSLNRVGAPWGPGLVFALLLLSLVQPALRVHRVTSWRGAGYEVAHKELAQWLQENSAASASVALTDVGIVGYYTGRYIIDFAGLVNPHIARQRHRGLGLDVEYVLSLEPDYLVLISGTENAPGRNVGWETGLFQRKESFQRSYRYVRSFNHSQFARDWSEGYYLLLYERISPKMGS